MAVAPGFAQIRGGATVSPSSLFHEGGNARTRRACQHAPGRPSTWRRVPARGAAARPSTRRRVPARGGRPRNARGVFISILARARDSTYGDVSRVPKRRAACRNAPTAPLKRERESLFRVSELKVLERGEVFVGMATCAHHPLSIRGTTALHQALDVTKLSRRHDDTTRRLMSRVLSCLPSRSLLHAMCHHALVHALQLSLHTRRLLWNGMGSEGPLRATQQLPTLLRSSWCVAFSTVCGTKWWGGGRVPAAGGPSCLLSLNVLKQ